MENPVWKEVAYLLAAAVSELRHAAGSQSPEVEAMTMGEQTRATLDEFVGRWEKARAVYDDHTI